MELQPRTTKKKNLITKEWDAVYVSDREKEIITNTGLAVGDLGRFAEISSIHACAADAAIAAARLITRIEDDLRAGASRSRVRGCRADGG